MEGIVMAEQNPIEVGDYAVLAIVTDEENKYRPIKAGTGAIVVVAGSADDAAMLIRVAENARHPR